MNNTSQVGRWQLFTLLCPGRRRLGPAVNLQHMHGELSIVLAGAPILLACAQYNGNQLHIWPSSLALLTCAATCALQAPAITSRHVQGIQSFIIGIPRSAALY